MTYLDRIQQAFGHHDVSNMREHIGSAARDSLNTLNARGYSSNGRMAFHGTPDLYTEAHEAAHGVQQAALETRLQLKGGIGEAGDKYEQHADAVAKKVVRGESAEELLDQIAIDPTTVEASLSSNGPVQMMHLISVGGGPRGVTQVNEEVDFLAKHKRDLEAIKKLGGKYDIRTTIIEKQEANALGRGAAWTEQNQGTVNTGSEGGYHDRLSTYYQTNKSAIEQELQSHSVGLSTFTSAFTEGKSGKPVTHRASTTRAIQGREELQHFQRQQERAEEFKDFYRLEVLTDTQVTSVDLSDTIHPAVDTKAGRYDADTIRLNTGTTVAPPVRDEGVLEHSYIGPMYPSGIRNVLQRKGLLDEVGMLIPGTKILTGGSGLSLYDQLIALAPFMNLFEPDSGSVTGYKVTDEARGKYQGAILATSNTLGKWIPPRHSHSPVWTQKTDPIAGIKEQHGLFLHNQGEEIFREWQDIVVGSVAVATGRIPKQVLQKGLMTEQLLKQQHIETEKHAAALKNRTGDEEQTLYGARRQGYLAAILGLGLERNLGESIAGMNKLAPWTFKGREGYLMHRAQMKGISEPGTYISRNNADLMGTMGVRMADITSSPFRVHDMMHILMVAGIAKYTAGSYSNIKAQNQGKALSFTDTLGKTSEHDVFIVSSTFQRDQNPAVTSLQGQVKSIHLDLPSYGEVAKHRRLIHASGIPSHVEDYGLGGKGGWLSRKSIVGIFAVDTNNKESATQIAPGLAYRRFAQEHLAAAGFEDPVSTVEELYEELLPTDASYQDEVASFQKHYQDAMEIAAYLRNIKIQAGEDAVEYKRLYEMGKTPEGREKGGKSQYLIAQSLIPKYKYASREDYFKRFVDSPEHIHHMVYMKAMLLASQALLNGRINKGQYRSGQKGSVEWS